MWICRVVQTHREPPPFLHNPLDSSRIHSSLYSQRGSVQSSFQVWMETTDTFLFFNTNNLARFSSAWFGWFLTEGVENVGFPLKKVKTTPRYTVFTSHAHIQELEFKRKSKIRTLIKNYLEKNNYHNKLLACLDTVKSLHGILYQKNKCKHIYISGCPPPTS